MRRLLSTAVGFFLFGVAMSTPVAAHTREEAMAMARRAAEFLHTHDRAAAFAAFSDPKGAFRDGDLYIFVMDATDPQLTCLAHGSNPGMIGLPQLGLFDTDGKDFHAEARDIVNLQGEGWVDYKWPNPITKKIAPKTSFVLKDDGLIIVAGIYL